MTSDASEQTSTAAGADVSAGDIRIGVFVCDCGSNIAGVVDVPAVVAHAKSLKNVVVADEGRWSCSVDYIERLKEIIKEQRVNRVVVASCTPRTHEPLFKRAVQEAGVNPYLLEFVSIREQVSWVHMQTPEIATAKAKDLVEMGAAKAALLEEGSQIRLPVQRDCLVIGGGAAGMQAALYIARQGCRVRLVEKAPRLGGLLNRISHIEHDGRRLRAEAVVDTLTARIAQQPEIAVFTDTVVASVTGYIGNYRVGLATGDKRTDLDIATIVVATGMREIEPTGLFTYDENPRVMTQLQLEAHLKNGDVPDGDDIVMINCVNSRNDQRGCCRIGCRNSLKNALALKQQRGTARLRILYRDLSLVKEEPGRLEAAKRAGIRFIRFSDDAYPRLTQSDGRMQLSVKDVLLGATLSIPADILVLTTGFQGSDGAMELKGHLKVSTAADDFFQEAHVKLGPLEFPTDGISLCGCAKAPMPFKESCEEGLGAAMRVSIPMRRGYVEADGIVAEIDLDGCSRCGLCWKRCPYHAIQVDAEKTPTVIKALCKGCGLCAADCPTACIQIVHYTDRQIAAQITAALRREPRRKIVGFVCHWCALGGVDMAGVSRLQYPSSVRLIRVMCSARVSLNMIERAFALGAAGVLVAGCEFPTCHYIAGNYAAEKRIRRARRRLARKGFEPERLWNVWCSAADGPKFADTMRRMTAALGLSDDTHRPMDAS